MLLLTGRLTFHLPARPDQASLQMARLRGPLVAAGACCLLHSAMAELAAEEAGAEVKQVGWSWCWSC